MGSVVVGLQVCTWTRRAGREVAVLLRYTERIVAKCPCCPRFLTWRLFVYLTTPFQRQDLNGTP